MAMFSRCSCGCLLVAGAVLNAALHHQDMCLREQPGGPSLYCAKYIAEPVHTHDDRPSNQDPMRWIRVSSTSSTSSSDSGSILPTRGTINWLK
jgi:hypothetical protein